MDHKQLTRKQKEFFDYITSYKKEHGIWPTYSEIAEEFGFRSPNSVTQNLQALLKKDYLYKTEEDEYEINPEYDPSASNIRQMPSEGIPVRGMIAAGYLQEAVDANLGHITMEHIFPSLDKMFALRVTGSSMKDAEINSGDFVLLMDDDIKDGDIGAVMYNGETSLKRIYYTSAGLRLEPANEAYDDIVIEPDIFEEVRVIGKYVGHVNRTGMYRHGVN